MRPPPAIRWASLALLTLATALSASAAAISFTVQVIAVSDQETALAISRDLLREGYPTYVVRSTGAQGDVYRVRIGAFANRSAALHYAESMPEVAGSRPVPALAEAIPQGIMPLAPRLLWQAPWSNEDVRVMPWPGGVAVRMQRGDPLRQARYAVFQDGEERTFEAWVALPLAAMPEPTRPPELEVPMIDLTLPAPPPEEAVEPTEPAESPRDADDEPPAATEEDEPGRDDAGEHEDPEVPTDVEPASEAEEASVVDGAAADAVGEPEVDVEASAPADPFERHGIVLADPHADDAEVGLLLVRDRWLWPPAWETDGEGVRDAFRDSLLALLARELGLSEEEIDALAYFPGGEPPPSVVVLDLSDPSARDVGRVLALGDPSAGIRPFGPPRLAPEEPGWSLPSWPATRIAREPPDADIGGDAWRVEADEGFVRLTLSDGASWRAGVGTPLWSDGNVVLAWDGERLLLYDFVVR